MNNFLCNISIGIYLHHFTLINHTTNVIRGNIVIIQRWKRHSCSLLCMWLRSRTVSEICFKKCMQLFIVVRWRTEVYSRGNTLFSHFPCACLISCNRFCVDILYLAKWVYRKNFCLFVFVIYFSSFKPVLAKLGRSVEFHQERVMVYVSYWVSSRDCHPRANSASPTVIRYWETTWNIIIH